MPLSNPQYLGWGMTPLAATNVAPLSYRDNATYLEILSEARTAIDEIILAVNGNANVHTVDTAAINAAYTALVEDWNNTLAIIDPSGVAATVEGLQTQITANHNLLLTKAATTYVDAVIAALNKASVGLPLVDNTADLNKPVSTATAAALALKAPLASPAFTGNPTGITKTHVGLADVDNTPDFAKPLSAAAIAQSLTDRARASHTGTQLAATISDFTTAAITALSANELKLGTYVKSTGVVATDTANIMAAHNAFGANGGTILLDAGPYRVTPDTIIFTKAIHLVGSGPSGDQSVALGDSFMGVGSRIECNSVNGVAIGVQADGCSFEKLHVINTSVTTPVAGAGIQMTLKGKSTRVVDCAIEKFYVNLEFIQGFEWFVTRCHIFDPVMAGIMIQNTAIYDGGDGIISDCSIISGPTHATPLAGIEWRSGGGLKVLGTKINCRVGTKFQVGIHYSIADGGNTSVVIVSGCSIENVDYCVLLDHKGPANSGSLKYITFTGNEVSAFIYAFAIMPAVVNKVGVVCITGNVGQSVQEFISLANVDKVALGTNNYSLAPAYVKKGVGVTNSAMESQVAL